MNTEQLNPGIERQVGTALEDIRDDHKQRYLWACDRLAKSCVVLDAGCGVGYGSHLLAQVAKSVISVDISVASIEFARRYWSAPNIEYGVEDLSFIATPTRPRYDAVVAFEAIEHLIEPRLFLLRAFDALKPGGKLFVSVPNEKVISHTVELNPFHLRHYTISEVTALLGECGFDVSIVASQTIGPIQGDDTGRFLILESIKKATRTPAASHSSLTQTAVSAAAGFVVSRAMELHRSKKSLKSHATATENAKKALFAEEAKTAALQRKLEQFTGFQSRASASEQRLIDDALRRLGKLEDVERDLRERLMEAKQQWSRAEEKLIAMETRHRDQQTRANGLAEDHHNLAVEREKLAQEVGRLSQLNVGLQEHVARLSYELQARHASSSAAALLHGELQATVRTFEAQRQQLLADHSAAVQVADCLKQSNDDLQAQVDQLSTELQAQVDASRSAANKVIELTAAKHALEARKDTIRRDHDTVSAAAALLEGEKQVLLADRNQLLRENADLTQALAREQSAFANELHRLQQNASQHAHVQAELEVHVQALKLQAAKAEQELALASTEHQAAVQKMVEERDSTIGTYNKALSTEKSRAAGMSARLLALAQDQQTVMSTHTDLVRQLQQAQGTIERLERRVQQQLVEAQAMGRAIRQGPPTLEGIIAKWRSHRYYGPFLYKAVRNSLRSRVARLRTRA